MRDVRAVIGTRTTATRSEVMNGIESVVSELGGPGDKAFFNSCIFLVRVS